MSPAADVLDCPCGYGRHSVPLARAGHRVVGGSLVVETTHRDRLIARFLPERREELPGGGLLLERRSFDPAKGMVETELTLIEADGGRKSIAYRLPTYTATELARLARGAGFGELDLYGDLEGAPFAVDSRLVLVAC